MDDKRASSTLPKLWTTQVVVGEHSNRRRRLYVSMAGAIRKEDVGISNDNAGKKPAHRQPKVS